MSSPGAPAVLIGAAGRGADPVRGGGEAAGDDQLRDHLRDLAAGSAHLLGLSFRRHCQGSTKVGCTIADVQLSGGSGDEVITGGPSPTRSPAVAATTSSTRRTAPRTRSTAARGAIALPWTRSTLCPATASKSSAEAGSARSARERSHCRLPRRGERGSDGGGGPPGPRCVDRGRRRSRRRPRPRRRGRRSRRCAGPEVGRDRAIANSPPRPRASPGPRARQVPNSSERLQRGPRPAVFADRARRDLGVLLQRRDRRPRRRGLGRRRERRRPRSTHRGPPGGPPAAVRTALAAARESAMRERSRALRGAPPGLSR